MARIIAPLDGSLEAERALPHARALAGTDPLVLMASIWHGEPVAPRLYLEERASHLVGPPTETRVVLDQIPSEAIAQVASTEQPSLVCMATHGRNTLGDRLGSTAEAVMRITTDPILLVGPEATYDAARADARNLAVAVDGTVTAEAIVPIAATFARKHGLHLWAIQAVSPAPYPFVGDAELLTRTRVGPGLDAAVATLTREHVATETQLLIALDPADAIVEFAQEVPASIVVVGTHARRGFARLALGNTALRVVHRSPCPVLVVRQ